MINRRILMLGLGDLAQRVATGLIDAPEIDEIVLASRDRDRGVAFARLLSACGGVPCRFVQVDALCLDALAASLATERPSLIVQCASLLSPWALSGRTDAVARALGAAGFAVQLPAQLPILLNSMRALKLAGLACKVVNCSYPDVTHAVLAALGLAPLVGIGNAGMIAAWLSARTRRTASEGAPLRVLAHHAHVAPVLTRGEPCPAELRPRVYVGDAGERADEWLEGSEPLAASRELNTLSAAHARAVIRALLREGDPLRTSAPGPLGLQGGLPVTIGAGRVELDLPAALTLSEAREFQARCATLDGVAQIAQDGSVSFTDRARRALAMLDPALVAPLHPDEALARFELLSHAIQAPPP